MIKNKHGEHYYTHDGLGSISEITDVNGKIVEYYDYDAYGKPSLFDSNGNPIGKSFVNNPYYFTGREFDLETGLYYYRARYYDCELGVFLETDPLGYIDSLNLYSYVLNNPVNWVDPWGESWKTWVALGGAVVAAGAGMAGFPVVATAAGAVAAGAALWELHDWMTGDAEELINETIFKKTNDGDLNPADAYEDEKNDKKYTNI